MRRHFTFLLLALCIGFNAHVSGSSERGLNQVLRDSVPSSSDAAVVMDISSGQVVAQVGQVDIPSTPGSLLKPLLLTYALEHNVLRSSDRIWCSRTLRIQGKDLGCTHPLAGSPLTPEQALAYSCNSAFAQLAKRLGPAGVAAALKEFSVTSDAVLTANTDDLPLYALGLKGTAMSLLEVARMERQLALNVTTKPADRKLRSVQAGLEGSVLYGAASNARTQAVVIAGKTGTASDSGERWTHGWFAGYLPAASPRWVIVFRVAHGSGGTAAHLAHVFVSTYTSRYGRMS